jgi:hypothetical protein
MKGSSTRIVLSPCRQDSISSRSDQQWAFPEESQQVSSMQAEGLPCQKRQMVARSMQGSEGKATLWFLTRFISAKKQAIAIQ